MNTSKVINLTQKNNLPFTQRMQVAKQSFTEPQKLVYKKEQEPTPFEQFMQQNEVEYRSLWDDDSEYHDAHEDRHFDNLSLED